MTPVGQTPQVTPQQQSFNNINLQSIEDRATPEELASINAFLGGDPNYQPPPPPSLPIFEQTPLTPQELGEQMGLLSSGRGSEFQTITNTPLGERARIIRFRGATEQVNPKTGLKPVIEELEREKVIENLFIQKYGLEGGTTKDVRDFKQAYRDVPLAALEDEFNAGKRRQRTKEERAIFTPERQLDEQARQIQEKSAAISQYLTDPTIQSYRDTAFGQETLRQLMAEYDALIERYETNYIRLYGEPK